MLNDCLSKEDVTRLAEVLGFKCDLRHGKVLHKLAHGTLNACLLTKYSGYVYTGSDHSKSAEWYRQTRVSQAGWPIATFDAAHEFHLLTSRSLHL